MNTCVESHTLESNGHICRRSNISHDIFPYGIRVIDVEFCTVVERNPEEIEYSALSYVWGKDQHNAKHGGGSFSALPSKIPNVVEDAIFVCKKLSIPYLWVDR